MTDSQSAWYSEDDRLLTGSWSTDSRPVDETMFHVWSCTTRNMASMVAMTVEYVEMMTSSLLTMIQTREYAKKRGPERREQLQFLKSRGFQIENDWCRVMQSSIQLCLSQSNAAFSVYEHKLFVQMPFTEGRSSATHVRKSANCYVHTIQSPLTSLWTKLVIVLSFEKKTRPSRVPKISLVLPLINAPQCLFAYFSNYALISYLRRNMSSTSVR